MTSSQNTKSTKRTSEAAKARKAQAAKTAALYITLRRAGYSEAAAARQAARLTK